MAYVNTCNVVAGSLHRGFQKHSTVEGHCLQLQQRHLIQKIYTSSRPNAPGWAGVSGRTLAGGGGVGTVTAAQAAFPSDVPGMRPLESFLAGVSCVSSSSSCPHHNRSPHRRRVGWIRRVGRDIAQHAHAGRRSITMATRLANLVQKFAPFIG